MAQKYRAVVLVVTIAASLVVLPSVPAAGTPPQTRLVERTLDAWLEPDVAAASASVTGPVRISPPIPADDTVLVGLDWGGDPEVTADIRTRDGGPWSPWRAIELGGDDAPDPGTEEGRRAATFTATSPVWIGTVDDFQLRLTGPEVPVELHTVEVTGGDGLGYVPPELRTAGAAQAAPGGPPVLSRSVWDPEGRCAPRGPPSYSTDVRFAVVHHTAGSNDYTAEQTDDRILADCLYHVRTRGWSDLAYNFVVDKFGRVFEGRAGGIDQPVLGGHALGFNGGSTGVVLLGTFTTTEPPAVARTALRDLLSWKLDLHHVDPHGTTREVAGGNTGIYRSGELATLPTVIGHRDVRSTSCPGDGAYRYLPWLRDGVAADGGNRLYGGPPQIVHQSVLDTDPVWDVTMSVPSPWSLEVTDPAGAVVHSDSGPAASNVLTSWSLRDGDDRTVAPGAYTATFRAGDATPIVTRFELEPPSRRIGGADAAATAAAASAWAFDDDRLATNGWEQSDDVVVASAEPGAFPYIAAGLAGTYDAPLFLSPAGGLPPAVAGEIGRLGARTAYVVGDQAELSDAVVADLKAAGIRTVERIVGAENDLQTAGRVAWRVVERESPWEALVVLSDGPDLPRIHAEATAAAGYAAAFDRPMLVVSPNELDPANKWVLEQKKWGRVVLIGGQGQVSTAVKDAIRTAAGGAPLVEWAGSDAAETATITAGHVFDYWARPSSDPNAVRTGQEIVAASLHHPATALPAAAAASQRRSTALMIPGDLGAEARAFVEQRAADAARVVAVGGGSQVSESALTELTAIVSSGSTTPPAGDGSPPPPSFDDIATSPHRAAIERIVDEGITDGCRPSAYCPRDPVTRGQMAKLIANAAGLATIAGQRYPDVPADHTFAGYINALAEAGIAGGYEDGTYRPNEVVTRAQMAKFVALAADIPRGSGGTFTDVPANHTFAPYIYGLVDAGVAQGYGDGRYGPADPVYRDQMATYLVNAFFSD